MDVCTALAYHIIHPRHNGPAGKLPCLGVPERLGGELPVLVAVDDAGADISSLSASTTGRRARREVDDATAQARVAHGDVRIVTIRHGRRGFAHQMDPQIVDRPLRHVDHLPGWALLVDEERIGGVVTQVAVAALATARPTGAVPIHAHGRGGGRRDIVDGAVIAVLRVLAHATVKTRPTVNFHCHVIGQHGIGGHLIRAVWHPFAACPKAKAATRQGYVAEVFVVERLVLVLNRVVRAEVFHDIVFDDGIFAGIATDALVPTVILTASGAG